MVRIAIVYAAFFAAVILIADLSLLPQLGRQIHHLPYCDKVLHFALYGGLALAIHLALASRCRWPLWRIIVTGSAVVAAVATLEEYSNQFVAVRDWSLGDLTANYVGIISLGVLLPLVTRRVTTPDASGAQSVSPPAVQ